MSDRNMGPIDQRATRANRSEYDIDVLRERADLWRDEAVKASFETMRALCLQEMELCERRIQQSMFMLAVREGASLKAHRESRDTDVPIT